MKMHKCYICNNDLEKLIAKYSKAEIDQLQSPNFVFERSYYQCSYCKCFQSDLHNTVIASDIFDKQYYEKIDTENLEHKFNRVMQMNRNQSDNLRRIERINFYVSYYIENFNLVNDFNLLDIGSGTGVFPAKFKELYNQWILTLIEPDPTACIHLKKSISATIINDVLKPSIFKEQKFDLICFNRCLEHMPNPLQVLKTAVNLLNKGGLIYIEVPDILTHSLRGQYDEAFGDAHLSIFSPLTLNILFEKVGLLPLTCARTKDPSGKLTCFGFATNQIL